MVCSQLLAAVCLLLLLLLLSQTSPNIVLLHVYMVLPDRLGLHSILPLVGVAWEAMWLDNCVNYY